MKEKNHFLNHTESRDYTLQNFGITLQIDPGVFPPSEFVQPFAQQIEIHPGERVIDIGTGSGLLAILATKLGGKVAATDISSKAIRNTIRNARNNGVSLSAQQGGYFSSFSGPFDVIIANLPQEILPPAYSQQLGRELDTTINGGSSGNEILLRFLELAPAFMHSQSRLYINVGSLSDYKMTFQKIAKLYSARLLNSYALPNKPFVEEHLEFYQKLNQEGKVHIFQEDETWKAMVYPFELRLQRA